jgi:hypothetical protein
VRCGTIPQSEEVKPGERRETADSIQKPPASQKKENSMKKQFLFIASLCLGIGVAVAPASAQSVGVRVKVPFNFTVSGKTFPAGDYKMITDLHQVRIEDERGRTIAYTLANDISAETARDNSQVVFNCYGKSCFLSELWSAAQNSGVEVYTSKTEKELAKEVAAGTSQN